MSALDVVRRLLALENARDFDALEALVHPDVEWRSWPDGDHAEGRADFMRRFRAQYVDREARAEVTAIGADPGGERVLVEFVIEGKRSVCVFEIHDGLLLREREYLGEGY